MSWNLEGLHVEGNYMGSIPVKGRVESSRIKYGGGVQHTVVLYSPVNVYNAIRDRVLLENEYVTRVRSNPDTVEVYSPYETVNS
jgi:hypothetical protein